MGKLVLADGESIIRRVPVANIANAVLRRETSIVELVLTEHRVVVLRTKQPPSMFGFVVALFAKLVSEGARIEHEIRRDDLATAEVTETNALLVRSKGEGYGMTWFEVTVKDPSEWADLLHRWAGGAPLDAKLPAATVVER